MLTDHGSFSASTCAVPRFTDCCHSHVNGGLSSDINILSTDIEGIVDSFSDGTVDIKAVVK